METSEGQSRKSWDGRDDRLCPEGLSERALASDPGTVADGAVSAPTRLKLKVNNEKSAQERKFLGFSFTGGAKPKRRTAPKAKQRFRKKVREITRRKKGESLKQRVEKLRQYLRGWRGYFGFCETPTVLQELDSWVRRRLRSCYWIQWKTRRRRFDGLVGLGVSRELAANTAGNNRGPWYLSKSLALSQALSNAYFDSIGLPRLAVSR